MSVTYTKSQRERAKRDGLHLVTIAAKGIEVQAPVTEDEMNRVCDFANTRADNLAWWVPGEPPLTCRWCKKRGQQFYRRESVCRLCRNEEGRTWHHANLERSRQISRECAARRHRECRAEVLAAYGGGNAHRRLLGRNGKMITTPAFYRWLLKHHCPKDQFRLLCHNCNFSLGCHGYCPHQRSL